MESIAACIDYYENFRRKKYILHLKNDEAMTVEFPRQCLYHLLGLHYLQDLKDFPKTPPRYNWTKKILNGDISQQKIEKSPFYDAVRERMHFFEHLGSFFEEEYCQKVVDFNPSIVRNVSFSGIIADNLLYISLEHIERPDVWLHLFLRKDASMNRYIPCSFFARSGKSARAYIDGQKHIAVEKIG